jgi:hypothetical protein
MADNAQPDPGAKPPQAPVPDTDPGRETAAPAAGQAPPADGGRAAEPPPGPAAPDNAESEPQQPGGGEEAVKDPAAAVSDEYAERDRAGIASVYIYDNRSYGVYAEGDVAAREVAGHDKTVASGARPGGQTVRPVSVVAVASRDRERLSTVAVSAGPAGRAAVILERDRLVILHGPAGVGKGTAGLGLLGFGHEVLSVDPSLTARDLTDFSRRFPYGKQRRYLVEGLPPATAAQLSGFVVRAAARDLQARDSYLVITADDRAAFSPELAGT